MNAYPHRLQGVPMIPDAAIGRALADGRAYVNLEAHCRAAKPLHRAHHFGFSPAIDFIDLASKAIIVAGLGACVAMWVS